MFACLIVSTNQINPAVGPVHCCGYLHMLAGSMLSARHASERLLNCWHGGSKDIEQIREDIKTILKEYLVSQDVKEVAHCLHDLSVPFYHHEVVRRAVEMALDNETALADMSKLLSHFAKTGIINQVG